MSQTTAKVSGPRLLLTVPETAQTLGIGRTLAWTLVRRGELPAVRIGRAVRVPVAAVESWIAERAKSGRE